MDCVNLVLLPIAYNDGALVPDEVFDRLMRELTVKFGGYTILPTAVGAWIDREGRFQPDRHRPVMVITPRDRPPEW